MTKIRTWAIIGGGNGGQTMAGHLGMMGQKVRLFDVMQKTVDELNALGEIRLEHAIHAGELIRLEGDAVAEQAGGFFSRSVHPCPA